MSGWSYLVGWSFQETGTLDEIASVFNYSVMGVVKYVEETGGLVLCLLVPHCGGRMEGPVSKKAKKGDRSVLG